MQRFSLIVLLVVLAVPALGHASPCKLFAVDRADKAQLRVYFTKFIREDNSGGKFKSCKIVRKPEPDTQAFFVTPFRQDATVVVHRSNWPN